MSRTAETPPPKGPEPLVPPASAPLDDWDLLFDGDAEPGAAAPVDSAPVEEAPTATRYLGFRMGSELYAVPLGELAEVVRYSEITPVPRVRPFIRGIVSVRGTIVPIVDLRRRLSTALEREEPAPEPSGRRSQGSQRRILITSMGGESFGLLVDEVSHAFQLEPHEVEPPPVTLPRRLLEYVAGIGRVEGRIYILLDLPVVLRFDAVLTARGRGEGA